MSNNPKRSSAIHLKFRDFLSRQRGAPYFTVVFKLLAQIIGEEVQPKRQIGFGAGDKEKQ
jgi:hypothetical protein